MERNNLTSPAAKAVFGCLIIITPLYLITSAQSNIPCTTPPYSTDPAGVPNPRQNSWPQGISVTVVIDQRFSPEQRTAIMDGMNSWRNNGSGVTFNFNVGVVPDSSTRPPANTVYALADPVNRADNQNFTGSNGQVESVYMRLGICTTPENLIGKTAHETGAPIRFSQL